jgi:glucose-1-phosphate adenylyltransferase
MAEDTSAIHAFVMAGGLGARLRPLTADQCKPALPFGADHRVVDFVLANLRNSGVDRVDLLVQYEPASLVQHVRRAWCQNSAAGRRCRVGIAPPRPGTPGYRGTADAVQQNLFRLDARDDDPVLVFGADHVYRMDVRAMLAFHRDTGADATVATLPVPLAAASSFGIVAVDAQARATAFDEKPRQPRPMPGRPGQALASMGNYCFRAGLLRQALAHCIAEGQFDFGQHVLPLLLTTHRVMAYDFHAHPVPGLADDEEAGYWRDVGTLDAYFEAHLDTLGPSPRFRLDNPLWPLQPVQPVQRGQAASTPPAPAGADRAAGSRLAHVRLGRGAVVDRAQLQQAVVGRAARVGAGAVLDRVLLLDGAVVGEGARLRNVIVDRDNHIPPGECIGFDAERDGARFPRSQGGIVVVPRGYFAASPLPARRLLAASARVLPGEPSACALRDPTLGRPGGLMHARG